MKPDEILDVRYFSVPINGVTCAVGWYAIGNWYGMISEDNIGGLRVRKGNILIGDAKTLNPIFKEPRFNGWVQGEVFVLSDGLIPNARRDDFERNELYFAFIEALSNEIGTEISSIIREASKRRNDPSGKVLASVKKTIAEAETSLKEGFNSSVDREKVLETLKQAEVSLKSTPVTPAQQELKKDLAAKLTETQESVEVSRNYKINQVSSNLDRKSKKVLEIISNILSMKLSKFLVDEIMAEIIEAFERK
jgi:molecular chaperone HtpG